MAAGVEPHAGAWLDRNGDTEPRARLGSARGAPLPGRVSKLIAKVRPVIIRFCLDRVQSTSKDSSSRLVADSELLD